jgi:ABC-type transport system involved in Fe-S cluster assembly fused permease/ATPase subunit
MHRLGYIFLCQFFFFFRGINSVLSALVFNIVPTIFEVSLVTGILVRLKRYGILNVLTCVYGHE